MDSGIIVLKPADFHRCKNIWDVEHQTALANQFRKELADGNRLTFIYQEDGEYLGEISLVFDMSDPDYTITGRRVYVSHLVVKSGERHRGIARRLIEYAVERARALSYSEMSIGVDLDNYPAIRLYATAGFDRIIFVGEDGQGRFVKLLKQL